LAGDIQGAANEEKPFGPVQPVAGVDFLLPSAHMNLNPVAVVFDFVNPLSPLGVLDFKVASWGLMNPGISVSLLTKATHKRTPPPVLEARATGPVYLLGRLRVPNE
jgi:hypothetical protein